MVAKASLRDYQRDLAQRLREARIGQAASKLGMQVGVENWLVDLGDAGEVVPVPSVAEVPLTRPWFRGLANIRGNLYGVVDFGAFLGGALLVAGEHARLVILGERFRMGAGLLVERSLGLRNPEQLEPLARESSSPSWVRARYRDADGRQWSELDVTELVQHPDFLAVAA